MTRMTSTFRLLTLGALFGGTLLAAGCGGGPDKVTRSTTSEQITTTHPAPVTQTETTTTEQIHQSH
jgi:hypothetical protein